MPAVTREGVELNVDWEKGRGGEDGGLCRRIVECKSEVLSGKPPACIGSGMKRGETWTFILELEGDTNGTRSPCERVPDPNVEVYGGSGEYCRREDEAKNDESELAWSLEFSSMTNIPSSTCSPTLS